MKKWQIRYSEKYSPSPMSFWVHHHLDCEVWKGASQFEPALPKPIPAKGFATLQVNALGVELIFASIEEIEHFLEVIKQKHMPTSMQLASLRDTNYGVHKHWLSRLPKKITPWSKREKLIVIIEKGLNEFKTLYKV